MSRRRDLTPAPDDEFLDRLRDVHYRPVFIMGAHRSGTTLLYKLLGMTGAFQVMTAYHVLRYRELISNHERGRTREAQRELEELFESLGLRTRLIDGMELNAKMPEEYGIVLMRELRQRVLDARSYPKFDEICRKLQYISESPDKPLLQKNPWDFDQFLTVRKLFPSAPFIILHRHPLLTLNSQLRALRDLWQADNPYVELLAGDLAKRLKRPWVRPILRWVSNPHARIRVGERVLISRTRQTLKYFLKHIESLPPESYVSLRYEDLCRDPNGEMARVMSFLNLAPRIEHDFSQTVSPRRTHLLPGLERNTRTICEKFREYIDYHGYERIPVEAALSPT